ncbi:hypothetical protein BO79DRAFT_279464 [Aspergillus costaricaensis CBS 115574]|uniref:Uncharacterized protein n=1 Tax=Aspergillus costaricaensis CBS 115574 TaxID=1448317 RepID=A0ACD1HY64_9EURO|nr:hypothetical protein BO79DRAFT_279464 [Aspergillus costaricaensis CBS 115574]RAK82942.1 hypothetical protein BO79DRAFT_279464 [Aspergillus costaricaensis CBS 115574]
MSPTTCRSIQPCPTPRSLALVASNRRTGLPTLAPLRLEQKHPMIDLPRRFSMKAVGLQYNGILVEFTCVHWVKIRPLLGHCPAPRLPSFPVE